MLGEWIDQFIGVFSPHAGLRRRQARRVMRSYDGAEPSRTSSEKHPNNASADRELYGPWGADRLRAWSRKLVRDNAWAWGVVDTIASSVIGNGINCQSVVETNEGQDVEDINDRRDKIWSQWCEVADINGQMTFDEIQLLCMREMVEAGEVLVRKIRTLDTEHKGIARPVAFALELIEADRLASDRDALIVRAQVNENHRIVRGVEVDEKGRTIAYWILPQHPNDVANIQRRPERVLACDVLHLFRQDRVGQHRGVTWFAPVVSWIRDLATYVENELQSSAIAACFSVAVKTETPIAPLVNPNASSTDSAGNKYDHLVPGTVWYLNPNESIDVANPGRPNSAAEPWINLMLRGIAVGTGLSFEVVSRNYSGVSYSSARTSMIEDRRRFRIWQAYIIRNLCQPTWDSFCDAAALNDELNGTFPTSTELLADRRGATPVEWQPPEWDWVDPTVEQTSSQAAIDSFMSDYRTELGSRGKSYRSVFYQRAKEEALRQKLGLLTAEEKQQAAMVAQTQGTGPDGMPSQTAKNGPQTSAGGSVDQNPPVAGTGEMANASRAQWNRNLKAIDDVLDKLMANEISIVKAKALLSVVGLSEQTINSLLDDVQPIDAPIELEGDTYAGDYENAI